MGEVREALKLVVNLLSLAREELVYKLRCANRGAGDGETLVRVKDAEFACSAAAISWSRLYAALLEGTGVRPAARTFMARASKAGDAAAAGPTTLMSSKYATICVAG
jgi:hypothetical protein